MITTSNKPGIYSELFREANNILPLINLGTDPETGEEKYFEINSLDDYFRRIGDLREIIQRSLEDENEQKIDPYFLILPINEEVFSIDANSRKITVPTSFNTYGIGVKGDEVAEIVYFSIDRYFDIHDLNEKEIYIQWKNAANEEGLSITINKSLAAIPGKVVFGWPISSEITKAAGSIQFSVRFYDRDEKASVPTLNFSFSTLTAVVKVNNGLDFNIADEENLGPGTGFVGLIDKTAMIYSNLKNSAATNVDIPPLEMQFIYKIFNPPISYEDGKELVYADLKNGELTLEARAEFKPEDIESNTPGAGTVSYTWTWIDRNNKVHDIVDNIKYIKVEGGDYNKYEVYYQLIDNRYVVYNHPAGELFPPANITIYKRNATCTATKVGKYSVSAINTYSAGSSKVKVGPTWEVPAPVEPVIEYLPAIDELETPNLIIAEDGSETKIISFEVSNDNDTQYGAKGNLTYQWKQSASDDIDNLKIDIDDASTTSLAVNAPGYYYLFATNAKNNDVTVGESVPVRVTYPPMLLDNILDMNYYIDDETAKFNNTLNIYPADLGQTLKVEVSNVLSSDRYDRFTYQWGILDDDTETIIDIQDADLSTFVPEAEGYYYCTITTWYNEHPQPVLSLGFFVNE